MHKAHSLEEEIACFHRDLNENFDWYKLHIRLKNNLTQEDKDLLNEINCAFEGVTCFEEKNVLYGSHLLDDYGEGFASPEFYLWLEEREERSNWRDIPILHLFSCETALGFAPKEAFHFLAPAYMCAGLQYEPKWPQENWVGYFCYNASYQSSSRKERLAEFYQLFTPEQKKCIEKWVDRWRKESVSENDIKNGDVPLLPWAYN